MPLPPRRLIPVLGLLLALFAAVPASGATRTSSDFFVTVVARQCPEYSDVMANRARNNIMESLRDLGKDTVYAPGQPIGFDIEETNNPRCTPLVGWTFTFGDGVGPKRTGPFGRLTTVRNPARTFTTRADVPRRDSDANPVGGGAKVEGAVTIGLNRAETDLAQVRNLWIQGGTSTDPINQADFPDEYGFAALRCAIDNLNGDNVEWIGFPTGTRHVICYAYYITPPPTAGTIVVEKAVQTPNGSRPTQAFSFGGTVSYNPGGLFTLTVINGQTARQSFVRAETKPGDARWRIEERPTEGWQRVSLACRSANGRSDSRIDGGAAAIRLAAGDTVTCRYTNTPFTPRTLVVQKVTVGGVGAFPVTVTPPEGPAVRRVLTTTAQGAPETFDTGLSGPGEYLITEDLPETRRGTWRLARVECDGFDQPARLPVRVTVGSDGDAPTCVLTNRFTPAGSLTVEAVTRGGLATIGYEFESNLTPVIAGFQTARTTREDTPARATGTPSDALPLRIYALRQLQPVSDGADPWRLVEVVCDGRRRDAVDGLVYVELTEQNPDVTCRFTNERRVPPPPPVPPDGGGGAAGGGGDTPTPPAPPTPPTPPTPPAPPTPPTPPTPPRPPAPPTPGGGGSGGGVVPVGPVDTGLGGLVRGGPAFVSARPGLLRVAIPAIGLRAPVDALGLRRDGSLRVPRDPGRAGWWSGGGRPGERSRPVVVVGHVDTTSGPAVFAGLRRVRAGDRVRVGRRAYVVTRVVRVRKSAFPTRAVYGRTRGQALRLVTCAGPFDPARRSYRDNLIVFARGV